MAPTRKKKLPWASCVVLRRIWRGDTAASASGCDSFGEYSMKIIFTILK